MRYSGVKRGGLQIQVFCGLLAAGLGFACHIAAQSITNSAPQTNSTKAEMDAAIHAVEKIVNQPVTAYRRAPGTHVSVFSPGWFHEGAIKPNFNTVDVRATQEKPYDQHQYVSSDLNPGIMFIGQQLEFNSMTKYFYTNRTIPKKKLTEAEMLEINRLYRIIGRCEQQLTEPQKRAAIAKEKAELAAEQNSGSTEPTPTQEKRGKFLNPYVGGGAILLLVIVLMVYYSVKGR